MAEEDQTYTILIGKGKNTFPIPIHFQALGEVLAARGHRVHFLVHHHHPVPEQSGNPSVRYWPWGSGRLRRRVKDFCWLWQMVTRYKPDCVIAGHRDTKMLVLVAYLRRIPVRILYHHTLTHQVDLDTELSGWQEGVRRLLRVPIYRLTPTRAVAVSSAALVDLQRRFHVPARKCKLLHNTLVDPLHALSNGVEMGGLAEERIVCVGRLSKSKGQDILLKAMAELKDQFPRLRVYFVGDGSERRALTEMSQALGLADHCRFMGEVPHAEVVSLLAGASLTVCPSRIDNLPTTIIESLSVGSPVVATDTGGIHDIFEDGVEGFMVPPGDPRPLAGQISTLLGDECLRNAMAKAARRRFLTHFEQHGSIQRQADWFEERLFKHRSRQVRVCS
jgi:glycosyltransferase involved in cell wall biosynthesis